MTAEDTMAILARVCRDKVRRGEMIIPALRKVLDDLIPGWETDDRSA